MGPRALVSLTVLLRGATEVETRKRCVVTKEHGLLLGLQTSSPSALLCSPLPGGGPLPASQFLARLARFSRCSAPWHPQRGCRETAGYSWPAGRRQSGSRSV